MTDDVFWEVGASGRRYSREFVLDTLEGKVARRGMRRIKWQTKGFHCLEVAPSNYLVTYTLVQGARVTRRATLWRRSKTGWKVLYHQGTVVEIRRPGTAGRRSDMLELQNIDKTFEGRTVLSDVNLFVPQGATHALIGSSGSGKTTLLRITLGLIPSPRAT